jgi:hypothetical protein
MGKAKDPTVREAAEAHALETYREMLRGYAGLDIELVAGHQADPDVLRYWAVRVDKNTVRAAILYAYPGRGNSLVIGSDGGREDVVRWLSEHGVPTVRLSNVKRPRN